MNTGSIAAIAAGVTALVVVGGVALGMHMHNKPKKDRNHRYSVGTIPVIQETRPIAVAWPRIPTGRVGMRPWDHRTSFHPHF